MTANRKNWVWIYGLVAIITGKCEAVNLDLKLDLSSIHATAIIVPDFTNGQKAIDGDTRFGQSGNTGIEKCATTNVKHGHILMNRYLKIDLKEQRYVTAIRLHLRDGLHRQSWQNGLTVELSNSDLVTAKHLRCGETFTALKHGQSPFFPCFSKARHIWIALRNTRRSLQICEVEVYQVPKLNLSKNGHAQLYPDVLKIGDSLAKPGNAIDGNSNIGHSGDENQILSCTSTELSTRTSVPRAYQYLSIRLPVSKMVYFVRAHLRDNGYSPFVNRRADQDGLVVLISDNYDRMNSAQCGSAYNSRKQGQSPAFTCNAPGQYVWIILNSTAGKSLQVCEVEVYATDLTTKCKDLSNTRIPNGNIIVSGSYVDSTALYSCNKGYTVAGDVRRKCQNNGMWSGDQPICKLLCEPLLNPKDGYRIGDGLTVGTVIDYICKNGYELIGDSSRSCLPSGQWSGTQPICQSPSPKCRDLSKLGIPNGRVIIQDNSAIYSCNRDFELVGVIQRNCQRNGTWTSSQPFCRQKTCNRLPNVKHGYRIYGGLTVGTVTVYICKNGYKLIGSSSRSCLPSGQWSGTQPICQSPSPKCRDLSKLPIPNGRVSIRDNSAIYSCNRDFELVGVIQRNCQRNGTWTGSQPFCRQKTCNRLPNVKHGYRIYGGLTVGTVAVYICKNGYKLIGSSFRSCLPSGQWSGTQPICQNLTSKCEDLSKLSIASDGINDIVIMGKPLFNPKHGYQINYGITVGTVIRYRCMDGYKLIGNSSRSCLASGQWSGTQPVCQTLDCGKSCAKIPYVYDAVLTRAGQFPWQAMLCSPHKHGQYCGGVLVSPDCIVTAAHCVVHQGFHVQNITTCLGRLCGNCSENDSQGNPQCSKPHRMHVHPQFDKKTLDNDIAVMKLRQPANLNCASVLPICLPDETRDAPYIGARKEGIVTGWGRVNSTVSRSICLRKGRILLKSRRICGIRHKDPVTKSMLCATDHNGACEGDSGGPLIVKNTRYGGRYVLAGIVSWGTGCGDREKFGVYTSVLSHLDWIKNSCGIRD